MGLYDSDKLRQRERTRQHEINRTEKEKNKNEKFQLLGAQVSFFPRVYFILLGFITNNSDTLATNTIS